MFIFDILQEAFGACGPYPFHATGNLDSPHRVFEFCTPVEVSMDVVVSFSAASGSEAVSSLLTVPNDGSELSWLGFVGLKRTRDQKLSSCLLPTFMFHSLPLRRN